MVPMKPISVTITVRAPTQSRVGLAPVSPWIRRCPNEIARKMSRATALPGEAMALRSDC